MTTLDLTSHACLVLCSENAQIADATNSSIRYRWDINWESLYQQLPTGKYQCKYRFYHSGVGVWTGSTQTAFISSGQRQTSLVIGCEFQTASDCSDPQSHKVTTTTGYKMMEQVIFRTNSASVVYSAVGQRSVQKVAPFLVYNPTLYNQVSITFSKIPNALSPSTTTSTTDLYTRGIHVFEFTRLI